MVQLFENVLTASVHGSIVIAAVLALRLVLKKTPRKFLCLLWLLAGLRLLMPFEIRSELSLQPETQVIVAQVQQVVAPAHLDSAPEVPVEVPHAVEAPGPALPETQEASFDPMVLLPYLWLGVACCFGVYSAWAYWDLKRKVRFAVKIPGGWESENIETAFILGFIRPKIYIPMGMEEIDRGYILAHERTHLEKGDHWIKMIGFLALAIHWFNPLVWLGYACLCRDIELACDERVVQFMDVQERKAYSKALLNCSSHKVRFAACPVAFGEVSVKNRVVSVLCYKKPGFWAGLLGVVAIGFVAVCLVTSPTDVPEQAAAVPETTLETEMAEINSTFAATLSEEKILDAVIAGIEELCSRESCRALSTNRTVYPARENAGYYYTVDIYRYGQDALFWYQQDYGSGTLNPANSAVYYGDLYGTHYGDYWVSQGNRPAYANVHDWAETYSPEGKTVTSVYFQDESTVCFDADWSVDWTEDMVYTGTIWVTFRDDGTIAQMARQYREEPQREGDEAFYYETSVTILEDPDPQDTYRAIADQAMQCITEEELNDVRNARNVMTEIPSNKTDYDQDVSTGIVSRQWEFLEKQWHCRIGSEAVTPTGLTQTFEESGDGHSSFTVEEGFWLETFDGANWKLLKEPLELSPAESRSISVSWETKDAFAISWADSYGELPEGYYRLGRYYTVTMTDGSTETLPCYCKFQIRNQDVEALLKTCEMGVNKLVNSTDYYLKYWEYLRNEEFHLRVDADSHDMVTEVWRSGEDFYRETIYRYKSDGSTKDIMAYIRRGGKGYCTAKDVLLSMEDAVFAEVDWIDAHSFDNWAAFAVLFSPTEIVEAYQDQMGIIHVKESSDFYTGIPYKEQQYLFNTDGMLTWYQRLYYNEAGEEIIDFELEVYRTREGETQQKIDSVRIG